MEKVTIYKTREEMFEMFNVPEGMALMVDEQPIHYNPADEMWIFEATYGTPEEIAEAVN